MTNVQNVGTDNRKLLFQWFVDNYDNIFAERGDCFVAIKDYGIIGQYKSFAEAVKKTRKTETPGTYIVQKCDGTQEAYTGRITSISK